MGISPSLQAPGQNCSWSSGYWDGCCLYYIRDGICSQASERYKDSIISLLLLHCFYLLAIIFWSHVPLFFAFCWWDLSVGSASVFLCFLLCIPKWLWYHPCLHRTYFPLFFPVPLIHLTTVVSSPCTVFPHVLQGINSFPRYKKYCWNTAANLEAKLGWEKKLIFSYSGCHCHVLPSTKTHVCRSPPACRNQEKCAQSRHQVGCWF